MSTQPDTTDAIIKLEDAVDHNGRARYEAESSITVNGDATIAPWLDVPPTPPPKLTAPGKSTGSTRSFGFSPKASLASFVSLQGSSVGLLRGSSRQTDNAISFPQFKRSSTDDGESSKGVANSSSSVHSTERAPKLSLFSRLKSKASKPNLRNEADNTEHFPSSNRSLHSQAPPLPTKGRSTSQNGVTTVPLITPTMSVPHLPTRDKRDKSKRRTTSFKNPPKFSDSAMENLSNELSLNPLQGIVGLDQDSMAGIVDFNNNDTTNKSNDSHHPSDLLAAGATLSELNPLQTQSQMFSNPWQQQPSPPTEKWPSNINNNANDRRKVSPKSVAPTHLGSSFSLPSSSSHGGSGSPSSPEQWVPPESWAIVKPHDAYDRLGHGDTQGSSSDGEVVDDDVSSAARWKDVRYWRNGLRKNTASSATSMISETRRPTASLVRLPFQEPRSSHPYHFRIYRQTGEYHVVALTLSTTVQDFSEKIKSRMSPRDQRIQHNLYLKEQGRERILGPHESPAAIVKLRQEQAGYDYEDGVHLFSNEALNMLLKFVYKSQVLAGQEQVQFENYEFVDLSGRSLRTIPVVLHQHADSIISLSLSRNPMIEIPLDFIQSCTALRELRLEQMAMKQVPPSLQHASSLHRLYLSNNSIKDLEDAFLDQIQALVTLFLQNNRLEKLPWHFPRLRNLETLNISNNKFRKFPSVLTLMESLRYLDVSFNMITELPEHIGKMKTLERFIFAGNQVARFPNEFSDLVNLRVLDCRRNHISDLMVVCMLPLLTKLYADHNAVSSLDLSLGPRLTTLSVGHNDVTQIALIPGPLGQLPYSLITLDLSYAKLSSLDNLDLSQLISLTELLLDHNSIRSIPDSLGELRDLKKLSCTDNKLDALPSTIGNLQKLEDLDAHNNSLTELPQSLWYCGSLKNINVTSNFISTWHDPPVVASPNPATVDGVLSPGDRKVSTTSLAACALLPPLAQRLQKLHLAENCLTENILHPLMIFKELRVLNLSFNEIVDLPTNFFRNMVHLEEIYLSGNKLTSLPSEDLPRLKNLTTLFLNANKLQTLPQELGKVANLKILDVGSNSLRYNTNNWEFDWNWNFNTNLSYLNLSGNKRLQIRTDSKSGGGDHRRSIYSLQSIPMLSGFTNLRQLRVLGLMDITITSTAKYATIDIPEEGLDRRIRSSLSTVCGMGYGIADSMGKNDHLTMLDLVHEVPGRNEAIFAMFGRTHPPPLKPGATPNTLAKFLQDNFVSVFVAQLTAINTRLKTEGQVSSQKWKDNIPKALHWTFLKLNQDLFNALHNMQRKNSHASTGTTLVYDSQYAKVGVSGIAIYFFHKTLFLANVGDALAVVSRQGVSIEISKKHDPYDREETARIRSAEGFISPPGLVNDEVEVSRSFGYFKFFPTLNAKPDLFTYELSELDEFVIIANRGLWDYVPYQTAVDIARTVARSDRPDPMIAAQKLRDFAISYGADGSTMIMVIWIADLFGAASRSRQPTLDSLVDPQMYRIRKKDEVRDRVINRLVDEVPPPIGHLTLVFTDIRNSTHLWETNPGMPSAMRLHNHLFRRQLRLCGGYEVKTEGDAFMCSFPTTLAAVWFCLTVQLQLLHEPWPLEILQCEDGKPITEGGQLIARGMSVRMGIHSGYPLCETDVITRRMDYFGPMVNRSARISGCAKGGQIMVSNDIIREIKASVFNAEEATEYSALQNAAAIEAIRDLGVITRYFGEVKLKGIELPEILYAIYPSGLESRHELDENPDPAPDPLDPLESDSLEGQFPPILKDLGLVCLSVESISKKRKFRPLPTRKDSVQPAAGNEGSASSSIFYADPTLLLPSIGECMTEAEFIVVLESIVTRVENAVEVTAGMYLPGNNTPRSAAGLLEALRDDGVLNADTLKYISSVLGRF